MARHLTLGNGSIFRGVDRNPLRVRAALVLTHLRVIAAAAEESRRLDFDTPDLFAETINETIQERRSFFLCSAPFPRPSLPYLGCPESLSAGPGDP